MEPLKEIFEDTTGEGTYGELFLVLRKGIPREPLEELPESTPVETRSPRRITEKFWIELWEQIREKALVGIF